jgi:hypothetical protein
MFLPVSSYSLKQFRYINLVVFNSYWYGVMLIASKVLPDWLGIGLVGYAVWHLWKTPLGSAERGLIVLHLTLGFGLECLCHYFRLYEYTDGFLPSWVLLMWLNFSLSLCHAWWPWIKPLWAGALLGLCAGIGPYYGASQAGLVLVDLNKHIWVVGIWILYGIFISWSTNQVMAKNENNLKP